MATKFTPDYTVQDHEKANMLSALSLGLFLGVQPTLATPIFLLMGSLDSVAPQVLSAFESLFYLSISGLGGLSYIAAIVLMIYTRVKYPKNVFGKVLMWIYIVAFVAVVVLTCAVIIACGVALNSCLSGCPG